MDDAQRGLGAVRAKRNKRCFCGDDEIESDVEARKVKIQIVARNEDIPCQVCPLSTLPVPIAAL
jgi:hypothetical protein